MTVPRLFSRRHLPLVLVCAALTLSGCNFIHNYGSGTHLDEPREKSSKLNAAKAADMRAEVITDASGEVVSVRFIRSSGSQAVDNYVADSIRTDWPGGPSMLSIVEISYRPGTGFSSPKVLSSQPAP